MTVMIFQDMQKLMLLFLADGEAIDWNTDI